jgi:hypothetical protein
MATLPERVVAIFSAGPMTGERFTRFASLHAPDTHFVHPLLELTGRADLQDALDRLLATVSFIRYEDFRVAGAEPCFMATWRAVFRLKLGPELSIYGASEFRSEGGAIVYQHDYWDVLNGVIDAFPRIRPLYRQIVAMLV